MYPSFRSSKSAATCTGLSLTVYQKYTVDSVGKLKTLNPKKEKQFYSSMYSEKFLAFCKKGTI